MSEAVRSGLRTVFIEVCGWRCGAVNAQAIREVFIDYHAGRYQLVARDGGMRRWVLAEAETEEEAKAALARLIQVLRSAGIGWAKVG